MNRYRARLGRYGRLVHWAELRADGRGWISVCRALDGELRLVDDGVAVDCAECRKRAGME